MKDIKTIVITWRDMRPATLGKILAALWCAEGTDADLNTALEHAHRSADDCRVHTFAIDNANWKNDAIEARAHGGGL